MGRRYTDPKRFKTRVQEARAAQELRLEKYKTYQHYQRGMEASRRYRGWVERKTTRQGGGRGGAFVRFGRGAAMAPAGLIEYGSVIPPAFERAVREPRKTVEQALPGLVASLKGTVREFKKRPYETGGEIVGQALITYGLEKGVDIGARQLTKLSPKYVSPRKITPKQYRKLPKSGVPSTERVPVSTQATDIQKIFRESKYTRGGEIVYHAAPEQWQPLPGTKDIYQIRPGKSPTRALYTAPEAYTPFAVRAVKRTWKPTKKQPKPTFYRIKTKGVELPKRTRGKAPISALEPLGERVKSAPSPKQAGEAFRAYKAYVESEITTGKAYVSPEAAAPIPWRGYLEVESTIGAGGKLKGVGKQKFTYVKVPSYSKKGKFTGYETVKVDVVDVELLAGGSTPIKATTTTTKFPSLERSRRGAVIERARRAPQSLGIETINIGRTEMDRQSERSSKAIERYTTKMIRESERVRDNTMTYRRDIDITKRSISRLDQKRDTRTKPMDYKIPVSRETTRIEREYKKTIANAQRRIHHPPAPTKKTKPLNKKKKKYDEELRKYEEELKFYDPEAWYEKHKIPTLQKLLGD